MAEYEPEFIIDDQLSLPDPLDSNIASVKVWTDTNDPSEGHDVLLSASVGSDIIEISVDGAPLETEIAIYQAEVLLTFANCSSSYGADFSRFFGQPERTISETKTAARKSSLAGEGNLKPTEAGISFHVNSEREIGSERTEQYSEVLFEHHASDSVRFGNWKSKVALRGNYVPHYRGWRVTRGEQDEVSGVAAILRVKKNWLDFIEVKPDPRKRLGKVFASVSGSAKSSDVRKKKLFEKLLKELTLLGLQSKSEKTMANLAISGFIVRPKGEREEMLMSALSRRRVSIPEALLLPILRASVGSEEKTFKSVLRAASAQASMKSAAFTPQSGYLDAKNAYYDLCLDYRENGKPFDLDKLQFQYSEAVITDLRSIGALATDRKANIYFVSRFPDTEPNYAFDALVGSQETIRLAEAILRENPETDGTTLGTEVAKHLNRQWSKGSRKRYGGQLKNWALRKQRTSRGRAFLITGFTEERVQAMIEEGRPATEIGRLLNINPETVRRYIRAQKGSQEE